MKKCILDTNILTAFLKKDSKVVKKVSGYLDYFDCLTIDIISYYEILRGLEDLGNEDKIKEFEGFINENELVLIRREMMQKAADIYAHLKKKGKIIEDADILIASIAMVEGLTLVTDNIKHFKRIEGLDTENWKS